MSPECKGGDNIGGHHIQPLRQGGDDSYSNLIALCSSCHHKKGLESNWEQHQIELLTWKFYAELNRLGVTSDCTDKEFLHAVAQQKAEKNLF